MHSTAKQRLHFKRYILVVLFLCYIFSSHAQTFDWVSHQFTSEYEAGWFTSYSSFKIESDSSLNIYYVYNYNVRDSGQGAPTLISSTARSGNVIKKFDSKGRLVYSVDAGNVRCIIPKNDGNLLVAGIITNDNPSQNLLWRRVFIGEIDSKGKLLWKKIITDLDWAEPCDLKMGVSGKISIIIKTTLLDRASEKETFQFYLMELSASKIISKPKLFTDAKISGVSIDNVIYNHDELIVQGKAWDAIFNGQSKQNGTFVAKYSSSGNEEWVKFCRIDSNPDRIVATPTKVCVDQLGGIYLSGTYSGQAIFDEIILRGVGYECGYLVKFDSNGNAQWAQSFGNGASPKSPGCRVSAIAINEYNDVIIAGGFTEKIILGGKTYVSTLKENVDEEDGELKKSKHSQDIFVTSFNSDGKFLWKQRSTGNSYEDAIDILSLGDGRYCLLGIISEGEAELGKQLVQSNYNTVFYAHLVVNNAVTSSYKQKAILKPAAADKSDIYNPKTFAVVIGISDYDDEDIEDLSFAAADAELYKAFLMSPDAGEIPEDNVTLLINENATRANIIQAMSTVFSLASKDDMIILYIAAHGQTAGENEELFILPVDAKSQFIQGTAISQLEIQKYLGYSKAGKKLIIADACHSGRLGMDVTTRGSMKELSEKRLMEFGMTKDGTAIISASSSEGVSYEKSTNQHGEFTYFLVEGLRGEADENKDGIVSLREVFNYVSRNVINSTNGKQHPELKGVFSDSLPLGINLNFDSKK